MSTPLLRPDAQPTVPEGEPFLQRWLREPLLHFALLGCLLFGVDHFIVSRKHDPRTIVVGAEIDAEARKLFAASRGREPDADELKVLRERWIDNEVLYREGLALQVDQGDTAIRERVIFKALSMVDASVKLPPFDDELLRRWFESKRSRYDEPQRFDFQEAVVSADASEPAVRAFAEALNNGTPGDAKAGLRVFKGRPRDNLVQSYGADFAKALEQAPPGAWRALPTRDGLRAIRLDSITPPKAADFEALRGVVLQDWTDATLADQRTAAVRAMGKKYAVKIEGDTK
ncbi:peptidylprolyl isomerase [Variovorax sp. LjRoot290]|uniref:peptidylprolyl isomerase n=1 Tax=unclassified Variovorax TaxID=663243 RepID=UPI003ECEA19D